MAKPIEPLLEELKSINKRLFDIDEDVNRVDRDLSGDRKDIETLKIEMVGVKETLKSIMKILTRFQMKTKEAVSDAVTESTAPINKQMKHFVNMKVLRVKVPTGSFTTIMVEKIKRWFNNLKSEIKEVK